MATSLHTYTKQPASPMNTKNVSNPSLHKAYTEPTQRYNSKFKFSKFKNAKFETYKFKIQISRILEI